jgi:hypothetical protein
MQPASPPAHPWATHWATSFLPASFSPERLAMHPSEDPVHEDAATVQSCRSEVSTHARASAVFAHPNKRSESHDSLPESDLKHETATSAGFGAKYATNAAHVDRTVAELAQLDSDTVRFEQSAPGRTRPSSRQASAAEPVSPPGPAPLGPLHDAGSAAVVERTLAAGVVCGQGAIYVEEARTGATRGGRTAGRGASFSR